VRVCFVVPCHGRQLLAEACLRQLARTCAELADASAVLVSDDRAFDRVAEEHGFGWLPAPNRPLGSKWNDGIEFACREGAADFVVPLGSDDVVDAALFTVLPHGEEVGCHRRSAVVSADGARLAELEIPYSGGDGVRILPTALLERVGFRPAADDRNRAIDGSMTDRLGSGGMRKIRYVYRDVHPLQIVDFKSAGRDQRNSYESCLEFAVAQHEDPWGRLAAHYPAAFLDEMRTVYPRAAVAA
jgi:hypothetical protein